MLGKKESLIVLLEKEYFKEKTKKLRKTIIKNYTLPVQSLSSVRFCLINQTCEIA